MARYAIAFAALLWAALAGPFAAPAHAQAPNEGMPLLHPQWSFSGIFGTYDRAALQRGFQVYKQVCSACHPLSHLYYRDLVDIGYSEAEVKAIAAQYQVTAGPNAKGEMFKRPALPSDIFVGPFPNSEAARAANGGALPPDLSMIVKARAGGPDYVYSILNGFVNPPKGFNVPTGRYYNEYFPGHLIAMPPPLHQGAVTFADGTPATVPQMAHDVATFLTWASHPNLETRHSIGFSVMLFLIVGVVVFYAAKRKIWSAVH
ncbi:MAG TPA: cytochrome c1 [Stellaceae bacterium]|nr:cytochrome c1 [Stellaceae bacterium]